jgi:hypothetical protein
MWLASCWGRLPVFGRCSDVQQPVSCDVLPVTRDLGDVPVILLLRRIMYLIFYGSGSTCFGFELIFFICEILIVCWDAE